MPSVLIDSVEIYLGEHMLLFPWNHPHLHHILLTDVWNIVQFVTSNKPKNIAYHHNVLLICSWFYLVLKTRLTGSQSPLTAHHKLSCPSQAVMVVLRGDRKQIDTHGVFDGCSNRQCPLQWAHLCDSITNYTVFSFLCLLSHSSLSSFQRRVKRRGIY